MWQFTRYHCWKKRHSCAGLFVSTLIR
jgi:hypothetical protein